MCATASAGSNPWAFNDSIRPYWATTMPGVEIDESDKSHAGSSALPAHSTGSKPCGSAATSSSATGSSNLPAASTAPATCAPLPPAITVRKVGNQLKPCPEKLRANFSDSSRFTRRWLEMSIVTIRLTPSDIGYDQWQGFELRAHWCYPTCNSLLNPGWKYKERKRKWQAKNSAGLLACHKIMRKPSSFDPRRFRRAGLTLVDEQIHSPLLL